MSSAPLRRKARRRSLVLSLLLASLSVAAAHADPEPADPVAPAPPPPPVIEAPEVTISATRSERDVLDVPGNVTVIDRAAIERSGALDVPDLLRREAGLFVTNTTSNPAGYNVEARGFQNGGGNGCHTLVLIDGRRANEFDTGCPDWSLITLGDVERIEIVRGPVSAMYGDNGTGGVIQIVTRHSRAEKDLRAVGTARAGSYDTFGGNLFVEGGAGPVTATALLSDDSSDSYRHSADYSLSREELGVRYALGERSSARLQGGYAKVHRQQPGDLTEAEWDQNPRQAEPGAADNFDDERERYLQGELELWPFENVRLHLAPYVRRTTQDTRQDDPAFTFSSGADIDEYGVGSVLEWTGHALDREIRLMVGTDASQQDADRNSLFDDGSFPFPQKNHARRRAVGVFLQQEVELIRDVTLSAGVRRDWDDTHGEDDLAGCANPDACPDDTHVIWSPRAALSWRFSEPVSAYVSYAKGFRYPNLDEAFGFFGFAPRLDPERSQTWETGLKLRRPGLSANLAVYHMNVSDEIFFDPTAINPITTFPGVNVNVDRVRHRGVEVSGSWEPWPWVELYGSYTYDDVEIELDRPDPAIVGNQLPITPHQRGNVGLLFRLPFGFELGANGYYVGARYLANDVGNADDQLAPFARYDARIGWKHELSEHVRLALDLTGYNLTNRRYAEWGGVSLFDPTDIGFFPSPERNAVGSVRLELHR